MRRLLLLVLCLLAYGSGFAQKQLSGLVLDAESRQALAFVSIIAEAGKYGSSTDIDGRFSFTLKEDIDSISFSYVGYKSKRIAVASLKESKEVLLEPAVVSLPTVDILPGENPAHRLIKLAIANREKNNPEKATAFNYESYNKLVFTADPDSAYANASDSVQRADSNSYEALQFFASTHLFLMESVTERNHIPPTHTKEVVKASRVSGLETPLFTLIGTQLQSFSLYNDYLSLLGSDYLSPLSKGSINKYLFILEDTLLEGSDTLFRISFRPRRGKFFDGLEGFINLNTDGYAVQNFIAEAPEQEDISVKIQQLYKKVDDKQWFPAQLNTKLIFSSIETKNFQVFAEGRSYIKNIELESKKTKKQLGNVVLSMADNAGEADSSFWQAYRESPLDSLELRTYEFMDSIGQESNLDKKMKVFQTIVQGYIPWGPIDFPLKRIADYNGYEGFRLGLGVETNQELSKYFRVGGYGAYGFKDQAWKYGGHLKLNPQWENYFTTTLSYSQDVMEFGQINFYNNRYNPFSTESFQKFFILRMDEVEQYAIEVETHSIRDFQFTFFGQLQNRGITSDYRFQADQSVAASQYFRNVESGVNIRYAYKEKFVEMFGVKTPISYRYPVVHFKYTRGLSSLLDGDYDFNRYDLRVEKNMKPRNLGFTTLRLRAGYIDNAIPLSLLYRSRGSLDDDLIIATDFSFQSVRPNEFFHDRYLSFFFKHSFKQLLFNSKWFKPELAILTAIGLGDMQGIERHQNIEFETMKHGFFESGLQLDRLLGFANLGFGAYYRYGAYAFDEFEDNWTFKATYALQF